jgi:hypothetical protein
MAVVFPPAPMNAMQGNDDSVRNALARVMFMIVIIHLSIWTSLTVGLNNLLAKETAFISTYTSDMRAILCKVRYNEYAALIKK